MEINITPEDVDRLVKDSILKAGLGRIITDTIAKVLNPNAYNNPINGAVEKYILEVANQLLRDVYADKVRQIIRAEIEKRVTDELLQQIAAGVVKKMENAAKERY